MLRWALIILVIGLVAPRIDNAGHIGGFLVGAGFAYLVPLGITQTVMRQKLLSVIALALLLGVVGTFGYVGYWVHDQPVSVEHSAEPQQLLFFKVRDGEDPDASGQRALLERCVKPAEKAFRAQLQAEGQKDFEWKMLQRLQLLHFQILLRDVKVTPAMVRRCEIAFRANANYRISYEVLSVMYAKTGQKDKARVLAELIPKLFSRK